MVYLLEGGGVCAVSADSANNNDMTIVRSTNPSFSLRSR